MTIILILLSIIPLFRSNLFALYILQLKNYRADRLKEFFASPEGKKAFFNKFFLLYIATLIISLIGQYIEINTFIIYGIGTVLLADTVYNVYSFIKHGLKLPQLTLRAVLILFVSLCLQVIFIATGWEENLPTAISAALVATYALMGISHIIILPLVYYQRKRIFQRARNKINSLNITSIGITGSYGKSSVKEFLSQILSSEFDTQCTPDNINTELGVCETILTKLKEVDKYFVAQMGAYRRGEIRLLGSIVNHKHGFLTAIGNQHIALFGSQENINKGKWEIAESVMKNNGKLYVNMDGVKTWEYQGDFIITYSIKDPSAHAYSEILSIENSVTKFQFNYKGTHFVFTTSILGAHQILNLTGVIAFCIDEGMNEESIQKALQKLHLPEGTFNIAQISDNIQIIDDSYNINNEGFLASMEFLNTQPGHKIVVLDDIIELGEESAKVHQEIGRRLCNYNIDAIILCGKEYTQFVAQGLKEGGFPSDKILNSYSGNIINGFKGTILFSGRRAGKVKDMVSSSARV